VSDPNAIPVHAMVEHCRRRLEPLLEGRVASRGLIVGCGNGDEAAQFGVLGLVDHTHAATAELLEDTIVRHRLADHDAGTCPWVHVRLPQGASQHAIGVGDSAI